MPAAEQRKDYVTRYKAGDRAAEAMREADRLEAVSGAAPPIGPAGSAAGTQVLPQLPAGHARRDSVRQFGVLVARQAWLLQSRARKENDPGPWQALTNLGVSSLPLLIAVGSSALAALVAGPPGLGAGKGPSDVGPTSLALLTTLCVLSGQALT